MEYVLFSFIPFLCFCVDSCFYLDFPGGSDSEESACNSADLGSIPGLARTLREGNGHPLQYSGLENFMDCIVHGVSKSQTQPSDSQFSSVLFLAIILCLHE